MASQLTLRVNVGEISSAANLLRDDVLARLAAAVDYVGFKTAEEWKIAVGKAKLWSGERERYADSITWKMTGPLRGEVAAGYDKSREIEFGRPPRDLKRMLDTSAKVRVNKRGQRYLVIPFRHNTPGFTGHSTDMPEHVYLQAKNLKASKVTGMTTRLSGTGAWDLATKGPMRVKQATYAWGGRLAAGSMGPNPKGRVDRFAGMYRFAETSGSAMKSTYMTFRVMSEASKGWVVPAQPGLNIAKGVIDAMRPVAIQEFTGAITGTVL